MGTDELEAEDIKQKVHDLAESMERVRSAQADRDDVVIDMKHAKISRLELLAKDLASVYNELPPEVEQFEFAITNGETPRFWIDMTSFVRLGADGREYEFVKDTRLGRTILARSSNREQVGKIITDYVAERVLERERMIEGDWVATQARRAKPTEEAKDADEAVSDTSETDFPETAAAEETAAGNDRFPWVSIAVLALIAGLFVLGYMDRLEPALDWLRAQAPGLFPVTPQDLAS